MMINMVEKAEADRAAAEAEKEAQRKVEQENDLRRQQEEEEQNRILREEERLAEEERQRAAEEAAELARQEAAEREHKQQQLIAARLEEEKQAAETAQKRKMKVSEFLKDNGFGDDVNTGKTSKSVMGMKKTIIYPIHKAAESGDHEMVALLLEEGAHAGVKNSSGKTAAEVASSKNKAGSHASVVRILGGA